MVKRIIYRFIRKELLKRDKVKIGHNAYFFKTHFEKNIRIGANCIINNSKIGFGTYINNSSSLPFSIVGRFCSIANNVSVAVGNHPVTDYVSTHPAFFSTLNQAGFFFVKETIFEEFKFARDKYLVEIGNDVWIGSNVIILNGVNIGDGAIIGAGSVVTRNIEPYSINVGVPAKPIKKRFTDDEIQFLIDLKWWNKDFEWIRNHSKYFCNIKTLIMKLKDDI